MPSLTSSKDCVSSKEKTSLPDFTLHYFGVKGAAAVTIIVLEQGNVPYKAKNWGLDMESWKKFKPNTPTGMMPLMEFDGGDMVAESGACSRVAAMKAGLLGEGLDYARSEQLIGMTADLWKVVGINAPTIMTLDSFKSDPSKVEKFKTEIKPKLTEKLKSYEKLLQLKSGMTSVQFTSTGLTLGEFDLWFRLYQLKNGAYPDVLEDISCLKGFYDRIGKEVGPTKYVNGGSQFGQLMDYFVPLP